MNAIIRSMIPKSLKTRLFTAFLLLIFLPFSLLEWMNISKVEQAFQARLGEQSRYQLEQVRNSFEEMRKQIFMTTLQLEQEQDIILSMSQNSQANAAFKQISVRSKLKEIKSAFSTSGNYMNLVLVDTVGNVYRDQENTNVSAPISNSEFQQFKQSRALYEWYTDDKEPAKLYLFSKIVNNNVEIGIVKVTIDYQSWIKSFISHFPIQQSYFMIDKNGQVLASTTDDPPLSANLKYAPLVNGYYVDQRSATMLTAIQVSSMDWTLAGQLPLRLFFGDIQKIQLQYYISLVAFTVLFVLISYFILSALIKPILILQKKMADLVEKQLFTIRISTDNYQGEILNLASSFNYMVSQMEKLIKKLKLEERQKESSRFQMLLSQMNPHFLLNTLNTIKWSSIAHKDSATANISQSLALLLESSLNSERDLICLHEEMKLIQAYEHIVNFRFENRFTIFYEYDEHLQYSLIPKFSLQPLVENSIRHGFNYNQTDGRIWIRVYTRDKILFLEVEDNGSGFLDNAALPETAANKRERIGLKNLNERLELLFRKEASLLVIPLSRGTLVRLTLPWLLSTPYQKGADDHVENIIGGR